MIGSSYRFHGHGSLKYVYGKGTAIRTPHLICKFVKGRRPVPRVAVVISKKVLKSAVGRNRLRRRIFELVRYELPKLQQRSDIVFIITSAELNDSSYTELKAQVRAMLSQADLYKSIEN